MRKFLVIILFTFAAQAQQPQRVVLQREGTERVTVRTIAYDDKRTLDLYLPPNTTNPLPVVVYINGVGRPDLKVAGQYTGWGRLTAAQGLAAVTYETEGDAAAEQTAKLLRYLRENAANLKIDPSRIAIWACSANVRVGTQLLADHPNTFRAAVLYYGIMTTPPKHNEPPVLVARAGLDQPDLNRSIDEWSAAAVKLEMPLTLINYPEGRHGFDLVDDTAESRRIMTATLDFLQHHLTAAARSGKRPMSQSALGKLLDELGVEGAAQRLASVKATEPVLEEANLNSLGYGYLFRENVALGLKVLQLNARFYPDSPNVHDSLADGYEAAGDKAKAVEESERALHLLATAKLEPARAAAIRKSAEERLVRLRK